jgi:hypothetical protein
MEPKYRRYEAIDMICEGPKGIVVEKPIEMKMEIGSLWKNYIVFPNCNHLVIENSGEVYCDVNGKNRCRNLESSTRLKRKFFPEVDVFGRKSLD